MLTIPQKLIEWTKRLVKPRIAIDDPALYTRAHLMASFSLFTLLVVMPTFWLLDVLFIHRLGYPPILFINALTVLIFTLAYWAGRYAYVGFAATLIVAFANGALLLIVLTSPTLAYIIAFQVIVLFFASVFYRVAQLGALAIIQFFLLVALDSLSPTTYVSVIETQLSFYITGAFTILFLLYSREKIEQAQQTELVAERERYRLVTDLMSDYAYSLRREPDGTVITEWITESFQRMTGVAFGYWQDVFPTLTHPDDQARAAADLMQAFEGQANSGEYRLNLPSGKTIWVSITRRPVLNAEGKVLRVIGAAKDISEARRGRENTVQVAIERDRVDFIRRLVLSMSHQFRTSLSILETNRYILERERQKADANPTELERLKTMSDYVSHMVEQLENLEMLAELAQIKRQTLDLNAIVHAVVQDEMRYRQKPNVTLITEFDANMPPLSGSAEKLSVAVYHLLYNANMYTNAGFVRISTRHDSDNAYISIQDSGIGIPESEQERIFELFYRVNQAQPVKQGGVGVGLSLAKMVAQAHGGDLTVHSKLGEGSTFTLKLPIITLTDED